MWTPDPANPVFCNPPPEYEQPADEDKKSRLQPPDGDESSCFQTHDDDKRLRFQSTDDDRISMLTTFDDESRSMLQSSDGDVYCKKAKLVDEEICQPKQIKMEVSDPTDGQMKSSMDEMREILNPINENLRLILCELRTITTRLNKDETNKT